MFARFDEVHLAPAPRSCRVPLKMPRRRPGRKAGPQPTIIRMPSRIVTGSRAMAAVHRAPAPVMPDVSMTDDDLDTPMRMAAFEHVRRLGEVHDHLTADELKPGFVFEGERIPLVNPRRGIFKSRQMQYLLSIKTVFPRPARGHGTTIRETCTARSLRATRRWIMTSWGRIRRRRTIAGCARHLRTGYR